MFPPLIAIYGSVDFVYRFGGHIGGKLEITLLILIELNEQIDRSIALEVRYQTSFESKWIGLRFEWQIVKNVRVKC